MSTVQWARRILPKLHVARDAVKEDGNERWYIIQGTVNKRVS